MGNNSGYGTYLVYKVFFSSFPFASISFHHHSLPPPRSIVQPGPRDRSRCIPLFSSMVWAAYCDAERHSVGAVFIHLVCHPEPVFEERTVRMVGAGISISFGIFFFRTILPIYPTLPDARRRKSTCGSLGLKNLVFTQDLNMNPPHSYSL